jgi:hypothetical protein
VGHCETRAGRGGCRRHNAATSLAWARREDALARLRVGWRRPILRDNEEENDVKLSRIFTVLTFVSLPVTAFASGCSGGSGGGGSSSSGGGPVVGGGPGGTGGTGSGATSIDSGAGIGDGGPTDAQCQRLSPGESCVSCCADLHANSYLAFINAIVRCECSADGGMGICQAQCATEYCAMKNPTSGDACDTCLTTSLEVDAGGQCLTPVSDACGAGGPCDAYLGCANGCR